MLFSRNQKQLILEVLKKEQRRLFSRHRGDLLKKTIADLEQMVRNEKINLKESKDNSIDWSTRHRK